MVLNLTQQYNVELYFPTYQNIKLKLAMKRIEDLEMDFVLILKICSAVLIRT